jgi:hypothetical protein
MTMGPALFKDVSMELRKLRLVARNRNSHVAVARDGVRLMRRRRRRAELASSASIAANSFSMARADGAPSAPLS